MLKAESIIKDIEYMLSNIRGRENKIKYLEQCMVKLNYHGVMPENGSSPDYDRLNDADTYEIREEIRLWIVDTISKPEKFDTHPLPDLMVQHLKRLDKYLISFDGKPNFKNLSFAIAFFDLWHDKHDIPDYNYKIIADNILVKGKIPTQTNINTTRSRGRGIENQKAIILKLLPELK